AFYHLLPFIEEVGVFELAASVTNWNNGSYHAGNGSPAPRTQPLKILQCSADSTLSGTGMAPNVPDWGASCFGMNALVFGRPTLNSDGTFTAANDSNWKGMTKLGSLSDGTSKTIMFTDKLAGCTGRNLGSDRDFNNLWARWDNDPHAPVIGMWRINGYPS